MSPIARRPLLAGLLALPGLARADAPSEERWRGLRHTLFRDRAIEPSPEIRLQAPMQARSAAAVPVTVRIAPALAAEVAALSVIVDANPEPLAAVVRGAGLAVFATRVRVDANTRLHAVVEMRDGRLLGAEALVAAAGGCTAPVPGDPRGMRNRLGGMRLSLPEGPPSVWRAVPAEVAVSHPNTSGLQRDLVTRAAVPAEYIRRLGVSYAGAEVLQVEGSRSLSEDPSFGFALAGAPGGTLRISAEDSEARQFGSTWVLALS